MKLYKILEAASRCYKTHYFVHAKDFTEIFGRTKILSKFFQDMLFHKPSIKKLEIIDDCNNQENHNPSIFVQYQNWSGESNIAAIQCVGMYGNTIIAKEDLEKLLSYSNDATVNADFVTIARQRTGTFVEGTKSFSTDLTSYGTTSQKPEIKKSFFLYDVMHWKDLCRDSKDFDPIDHWMEFFVNPDSRQKFIDSFAPECTDEIFIQDIELIGAQKVCDQNSSE